MMPPQPEPTAPTAPRPRAAWRDMDYAAKFLAVNRWSLILLPWFAAALVAWFVLARSTGSGHAVWGGVAVALASCVAGSIALQTNAELRLHPHPRGRVWLRWGLLGHLIALSACALLLTLGPKAWLEGTAIAAASLFFTTLLAYLPFLKHGGVATVAALLLVFGMTSTFASAEVATVVTLYGVVFAAAVPFTKWFSRAMIETERARQLEAQLSAAEERLRLSQDLHDTMGQHLAAMTIKTQLAQALAARHDPRLNDELTELHQLTQTAAADMRHVVNRYRTPDLATELAGAKQVLTDAGATVTITGTSADVPAYLRETAAWFIREAATNVLRHSQATQVSIEVTPAAVTVTNDRPEPSERAGAGLEGLRRRAAEHGAHLAIEQSPDRFTVALKVGP